MEVGQEMGEMTTGLCLRLIRPEDPGQSFARNRVGRTSQEIEERTDLMTLQEE